MSSYIFEIISNISAKKWIERKGIFSGILIRFINNILLSNVIFSNFSPENFAVYKLHVSIAFSIIYFIISS